MIEKLKDWAGSGIVGSAAFGALTWFVSYATGSWSVVWVFARAHASEAASCALSIFALGILIGFVVRGGRYNKQLVARDNEIAELRNKVQASKIPGAFAATETMAGAVSSLTNEKISVCDNDFITFSEMDYEMRCVIYAFKLAGGSMTLWPDYEPDFEMAVVNLSESDKVQASRLRDEIGALYDFGFIRCESAPGGLYLYFLTDEAERVIGIEPDMMKRAEEDSNKMLDFLTRVSSRLVFAKDSTSIV